LVPPMSATMRGALRTGLEVDASVKMIAVVFDEERRLYGRSDGHPKG
jgi:hypothetical protein